MYSQTQDPCQWVEQYTNVQKRTYAWMFAVSKHSTVKILNIGTFMSE